MTVRDFKIQISDNILEDLSFRLKNTKWASVIQNSDWGKGTSKEYLWSLVDYWKNGYDWRAQERELNRWPQYKCNIDGVDIHFFHVKGKGKNPLPIILTHGWPDSFVRYLKVIPLLTDPASYGGSPDDSFDVIIPSLPGVGFSSMSSPRGYNNSQIADLWAKLMAEKLCYTRFGAAGGDMGSGITRYLALNHPTLLTGIHLTDVGIIRGILTATQSDLSAEEKQYRGAVQQWIAEEGGYMSIQSTKPQTIAYALSDSPVGLAAWIIEKFYSWSDCSSKPFEDKYSMDELLNNVMIYWLNNSIAYSARMYYENTHSLPPMGKIDVATGVALFAKDILLPPRAWVEKNLNLVHWTEMSRGGHFAAMEEPELFAQDIRKFYRTFQAKKL